MFIILQKKRILFNCREFSLIAAMKKTILVCGKCQVLWHVSILKKSKISNEKHTPRYIK